MVLRSGRAPRLHDSRATQRTATAVCPVTSAPRRFAARRSALQPWHARRLPDAPRERWSRRRRGLWWHRAAAAGPAHPRQHPVYTDAGAGRRPLPGPGRDERAARARADADPGRRPCASIDVGRAGARGAVGRWRHAAGQVEGQQPPRRRQPLAAARARRLPAAAALSRSHAVGGAADGDTLHCRRDGAGCQSLVGVRGRRLRARHTVLLARGRR